MTDNFQRYKELITLCGGLPDDNEKGNLDRYYVVELMRRGKDNPDLPAANYHFRNYYIYSWRDLDRYEQEIKQVCNLLNLRAYCSVGSKRMSQVALDTLAESARRIAAHDYKRFYSIFESCSGKYCDRGDQLWVVDIDDTKDEQLARDLCQYIRTMESGYDDPVVYVMPTRTGQHIITRPFNLKRFQDGFSEVIGNRYAIEPPTVKKNHLTLLYENLNSPDVADPLDDITLRPGATVTLPLPQPQGEPKPLLMALDWCDADLVRLVLSDKIVSLLCQQNGFMADPEMRRLASAIERMSKICDYIIEYQRSNTKDK